MKVAVRELFAELADIAAVQRVLSRYLVELESLLSLKLFTAFVTLLWELGKSVSFRNFPRLVNCLFFKTSELYPLLPGGNISTKHMVIEEFIQGHTALNVVRMCLCM